MATLGSILTALAPMACYPLDETSGTTANDISGNARHATYQAAVTLAHKALPARLGGGSAARFTGVATSHVLLPTSIAVTIAGLGGASDVPLSFAFLAADVDATAVGSAFTLGDMPWTTSRVQAHMLETNTIKYDHGNSSGGRIAINYVSPVDRKTDWHFVVIRGRSGFKALDIDGQRMMTTATTDIPTDGGFTQLTGGKIGRWQSNYLTANLAYFSMWNRVLADNEVAALYRYTLPGGYTGMAPERTA